MLDDSLKFPLFNNFSLISALVSFKISLLLPLYSINNWNGVYSFCTFGVQEYFSFYLPVSVAERSRKVSDSLKANRAKELRRWYQRFIEASKRSDLHTTSLSTSTLIYSLKHFSLSASMSLTLSHTACKWNHAVLVLLWLVYFT